MDIVNYLINNLLPFLNRIGIIVSGILLFFVVYYIAKFNMMGKKVDRFMELKGADMSRRTSIKAWKQIQKMVKSKSEIKAKKAILECNKILDEILKIGGYQGTNVAERLNQMTEAQLSNIREVKEACRICNKIKNEPDFKISPQEASNIVEIYEKAFKEFELLD